MADVIQLLHTLLPLPLLNQACPQSLLIYIYQKNEWNMLGYDLHFMVSLPWAIRLSKN